MHTYVGTTSEIKKYQGIFILEEHHDARELHTIWISVSSDPQQDRFPSSYTKTSRKPFYLCNLILEVYLFRYRKKSCTFFIYTHKVPNSTWKGKLEREKGNWMTFIVNCVSVLFVNNPVERNKQKKFTSFVSFNSQVFMPSIDNTNSYIPQIQGPLAKKVLLRKLWEFNNTEALVSKMRTI